MEDIIAPIDKKVLKSELTEDKRLRFTNKSNNEIYSTLFSACAHEYNWQKTRQKIKNPTLNFTKCWISEV